MPHLATGLLAAATACWLTAVPVLSAELPPVELDSMVVVGAPLITATRQTGEAVATGSEVTRAGLDALGARAAVSVYEAIDLLPGVGMHSADPYGLAAEQRTLRMRGVRGILGALSVAGIPNYGGNPMGPRDYVYDVENLRSIAVYKGVVPADLGTGVGARGGAIELRPRWPESTAGVHLGQALGASRYRRTFLRADSGPVGRAGTRLAASASHTGADKWKGPGDLGPRRNLSLMLAQPLSHRDTAAVWLNLNDLDQHLYRPLSHAEAQQLDAFSDVDHNPTLTGDRLADIDYFDHNRASHRNTDLMAILPVTLSQFRRVTVKPYWSREDAEVRGGSAAQGGLVTERTRSIERVGVVAQAEAHLATTTATAGYWFEALDMVIRTANYHPVTLDLLGRGVGVDSDQAATSHRPYLQFAGSSAGLIWQAGLSYFSYREPSSRGYVAPAPTFEPVLAPDLDRRARTYRQWLPSVGIARPLGEALTLTAGYGRSQIRPYAYLPLINLYNRHRTDFQAAGVTLDQLFDGVAMETTDGVELGAHLRWHRLGLRPTVYRTWHHDLLITVLDPRVGVSYGQNLASASGHGVELEATLAVSDRLTVFCHPAYTRLTYDGDVTFAGNTVAASGRQVVDTPQWSVKAGAFLTHGRFQVVPMVRFMGTRHGDVEHREDVDAATVVDLRLAYARRSTGSWPALRFGLELMNLFDQRYISVINTTDDARAGRVSYHVGPPFTALASVTLEL